MAKQFLGYGLGLFFALAFGFIGWFVGLSPLLGTAGAWWETRDWVEVKATVDEADLQEYKGRKSTSYTVKANYSYEYRGRTFIGHRVGLYDSTDNIDDWHQHWHRRLKEAQARGERINAWIDPEHPQKSLLERDVRWRSVVFHLPFATLFPLISVLGIWLIWKTATMSEDERASPSARYVLQPNNGGTVILCVVGTFFTILGGCMALIVLKPAQAPNAAWFILVFPVAGMLILWFAISEWLGRGKPQDITVHLDNPAPHLGGRLSGQVRFVKLQQGEKYALSLTCEQVDTRGDSNTHSTFWCEEVQLKPFGFSAHFDFAIPAGQPASQPEGKEYHRWLLLLQSDAASYPTEFSLQILAPTVASANPAPIPASGLAPVHKTQEPAFDFPADICTVDEGPGCLSIVFNPKRLQGEVGVLFGLAALFLVIGGLVFSHLLKPVGIYVSLFGALFLYAMLRAIKDDIRMTCDESAFKVTYSTLFTTKTSVYDPREIEYLIALPLQTRRVETLSDKQSYELIAITREGLSYELFRAVRNRHVIEAIMHKLQRFLPASAKLADIRDIAGNRAMLQRHPPRNISWVRKNMLTLMIGGMVLMAVTSWISFFMGMNEDSSHPRIEATAEAWFTAMDAERLADLQAIAKLGFPIDTPAESGGSALAFAATRGNLEIARWLLDAGADLHHRNSNPKNGNYKSTPLMRAGYGANPELMAMLLERGARIEDVDAFQRTPLHFAAWGGCIECIRMLVNRGSMLEARATGDRGETPLMSAAGGGRVEGVKALLALGADINAKDDYGYDALDWAEYHKRPEVIDYLKSYPR